MVKAQRVWQQWWDGSGSPAAGSCRELRQAAHGHAAPGQGGAEATPRRTSQTMLGSRSTSRKRLHTSGRISLQVTGGGLWVGGGGQRGAAWPARHARVQTT